MANTLTGGFGLRPIGKTGGNPNRTEAIATGK